MKSSIRVILALVLVACMMLGVGCSSSTTTATPTVTEAPATEESNTEEAAGEEVVTEEAATEETAGEETATEEATEETAKEETAVTGAAAAKGTDDSSVSRIDVDDNGWVDVVCGGNYTLALTSEGTLCGWGRNSYGQVGYGVVRDTNIMAIQPVLENTVFFCAGEQNSCAIDANGVLYLWGANHSGQIGDGTNTGYISPTINKTLVETGDTIIGFASGMNVTFALAEDGTLYASGKNDDGQLGGTEKTHKTPVAVLEDVAKIYTNGTFSMAIKNDGTIWVTGEGKRGELGLGADIEEVATWTEVTTISDVTDLALGEEFTLALKSDGTVWSVGRNNKGQLGIASEEKNMTEWTQVAEGAASIFADAATAGMVKTDGTLWMWGDNSKGQVGCGSDEKTIDAPVQIMEDVQTADCGFTHAVALKTDGSLWTWGNNYYYELCNGTTTNSNVPAQIISK